MMYWPDLLVLNLFRAGPVISSGKDCISEKKNMTDISDNPQFLPYRTALIVDDLIKTDHDLALYLFKLATEEETWEYTPAHQKLVGYKQCDAVTGILPFQKLNLPHWYHIVNGQLCAKK